MIRLLMGGMFVAVCLLLCGAAGCKDKSSTTPTVKDGSTLQLKSLPNPGSPGGGGEADQKKKGGTKKVGGAASAD